MPKRNLDIATTEKAETDELVKQLTRKKETIKAIQNIRTFMPDVYFDIVKNKEEDRRSVESEKEELKKLSHDLELFKGSKEMEM